EVDLEESPEIVVRTLIASAAMARLKPSLQFVFRKAVECLLVAAILEASLFAQTNSCAEPARTYQVQQYRINAVRIDTPLSWIFGSVAQRSQNLLSALPIKKGDLFDEKRANEGFKRIEEDLPELKVNPYSRLAFRFGRPTLQNCDSRVKTLDIVYRIYSF